MDRLQEIGKEIRSQLMLSTRPVAIKLIKKLEEFPSESKFPRKDLNAKFATCQAVHIVRTWGITLGMREEDFLEMPCPIFWGFNLEVEGKELTDEEMARHWAEEMDLLKNEESGMNMLKTSPRIPRGEYIGVAISPLETTRIVPDVVIIYGRPVQIQKLILALNYGRGVGIDSNFTAATAFCRGGIGTFLDRKPNVFIPGGGERGIAMTQDDELGIAIPTEGLEETIEGLKAGKTGASKFPVASYLHFTATQHPYAKLGAKVGKRP